MGLGHVSYPVCDGISAGQSWAGREENWTSPVGTLALGLANARGSLLFPDSPAVIFGGHQVSSHANL